MNAVRSTLRNRARGHRLCQECSRRVVYSTRLRRWLHVSQKLHDHAPSAA